MNVSRQRRRRAAADPSDSEVRTHSTAHHQDLKETFSPLAALAPGKETRESRWFGPRGREMPTGYWGGHRNGNGKDFEVLKEPFHSPASGSSLGPPLRVPTPVGLLPGKRGPGLSPRGFGRGALLPEAVQGFGLASFLFSPCGTLSKIQCDPRAACSENDSTSFVGL